MTSFQITGLMAATYTPLADDGSLHLSPVQKMVDYLVDSGVTGLYVCGSTGEGVSLSSDERKSVAATYVKAANGRVPVVVQVGHNSIVEAKALAAHAANVGADAISATCPSYFKVSGNESLVECMKEVASGASQLPFYYYHIPILTGSTIDLIQFMEVGGEQISNLAGLKYTAPLLHEFQECLLFDDGRFDVVWGTDEMLLGALATGAKGAIGSTYNIMAPLYVDIMKAFESQDLDTARKLQARSWKIIRMLAKHPFHSAMKEVLKMMGHDVGRCRSPQQGLSDEQVRVLRSDLKKIGFID